MLKQRILTALILIPLIFVAILWLDTGWFSFIFAIILVLASWEWARVCGLNEKMSCLYSLFTVLIFSLLFYLNDQRINFSIIVISNIFWIFGFIAVVSYQFRKKILPSSLIIMMFIGQLLLISTWLGLSYLKSLPVVGSYLVIYLMFLIWAADSGAYFIGRKWGRSRLASHVSPGKTWEGTIAGIISGLFVTMIYLFISKNISNELVFAGISLITILMSIVGDLMESMVKRIANIKDSGSILPGHGGVMDRIDSLTAACPVFAFCLILSGMYR